MPVTGRFSHQSFSILPTATTGERPEDTLSGPVLFCFDGSDGSRGALRAAANLIDRPVDAVVITVWETVATRLALSGAFAAGSTTGGADLDVEEESFAKSVADDGAQRASERARVQRLANGKGVLRGDRQGNSGGRGRRLGSPDRLRPARQRGATCDAAWKRLALSGVTCATPDPDRS